MARPQLACELGGRPGELRALNVSDYDFKTPTVTLRHAMDGDTNAAQRGTLTEGRRRGLPLDQLQKAAGHKDARSTEVYADLAQEQATRVLRLARKPR